MKLTWDISELTDFGDNLKSLGSAFSPNLQRAVQDIARALLEDIKALTPIAETGRLIHGWDNNNFLVKPLKSGYVVELVNTTAYARAVNDGHHACNQFGGPYPIHDEVSVGPFGKLRGRIAVQSPHQWQQGDLKMYVFGHFFVERGILKLENTDEIERIIMRELQKWWKGV